MLIRFLMTGNASASFVDDSVMCYDIVTKLPHCEFVVGTMKRSDSVYDRLSFAAGWHLLTRLL